MISFEKKTIKWLLATLFGSGLTVMIATVLVLAGFSGPAMAGVHPQVRLKDLGRVEGIRSNQLVGMGLVVGLQGTGDKGDLVLAMLGNLADNFGIAMNRNDLKSKNAAVVTVICQLPPFARNGQEVDITVSAAGDAKSLQGGILLQTPLKAANGQVYAVAQGAVVIGGYTAGAAGSSLAKNISTTGRIPRGAIVERETRTDFDRGGVVRFILNHPDFTTADRVANAVNNRFGAVAMVVDPGCVEMRLPAEFGGNASRFVASMERLGVTPDAVARVVINERTGTVVMGGDVRISQVAVTHGDLTVNIGVNKGVSQPGPFSETGTTEVVETAQIGVEEEEGKVALIEATSTVNDVVESLNSLGASPRDMISILQAIDRAGALQGELVIM